MHMEEWMDKQAEGGEVTAQALEDSLGGAARPEMDEEETRASEIREGIGELFSDGWTTDELAAFSQDEQAQRDVASGMSVARAACQFLRRAMAAKMRRGVPTMRATQSGALAQESRIDQMTDEEFDAFSRRARAAAMEGRRVRM